MASGAGENRNIDRADYTRWLEQAEPLWRKEARAVNCAGPLFSIVFPVYNTPLLHLRSALDSILDQSYGNWQLCIVDDGSSDHDVRLLLADYRDSDDRVEIVFRTHNGGIAAASNEALAMARGHYVALIDHDDVLPDHALALVAKALEQNPTARFLYSDSDRLDSQGRPCQPYFKPDWNYDLFLAQNYLNHLSVFDRDLLRRVGGFREGYDGSQDYDLMLRVVEQLEADEIVHIPRVLYHWRELDSSVSGSNLATAVSNGRRAVAEHLQRIGSAATVSAADGAVIYNRVSWPVPEPAPEVGIILYGRDIQLLQDSAEKIRTFTDYPNFNIHQCPVSPGEFPRSLRPSVEALREDLVLVLSAGLYPEADDWLRKLAGIACRPEVGCVGLKCVAPDGSLANGPPVAGIADEARDLLPPMARGGKGYHARFMLDHEVAAVHGAALIGRRDVFMMEEGAQDSASGSSWGADLALAARAAGLKTIWAAQVVMRCSQADVGQIFSEPAS